MSIRGRGRGGYLPSKSTVTPYVSSSTQSLHSSTSKLVHPTASASESMHEVTSQSSSLDASSTDCSIVDTSTRKKGRGKSRSLALAKIKNQGKRLPVEICRISGVPLGDWSDKFSTELGIITRQFAPQNVPKWKFVSPEDQATLIAYLREGFSFSTEPYAIESILNLMKIRYKSYRHDLRQHFRSFSTMESALANPPEDMEQEVWRYLCELWSDKKYKEKCLTNKKNRAELKVLHTAGSKAFRKVQYDERDENGKEAGLVRLYEKTHFSKKKKAWVHDEAEIRHNKLKELENKAIEDGSGPLSDEQLSIEVFGLKSGYISGLGRGPKPSITLSGRRTRVALERENEESRREIEEQRRINEESRREIEEQRRMNEQLVARLQNLESNSMEVNAKLDLMMQQILRGGPSTGFSS